MSEKLGVDVVDQRYYEEESNGSPQRLYVDNAGLALLNVGFPRLFKLLNLLSDEKVDFKDMESRVRAIFILQHLVSLEDREYKESELVFNRILVGCPFSVSLPSRVELTKSEIETTYEILAALKNNWSKVDGTSIAGFQCSFIERSGLIEQNEDKWLLSVDNRSFDILLDSLPWSYSPIRFPWLKKPISVQWRSSDKTEF